MPGATRVQQGNEVMDMVLLSAAVTYPTLAASASGTNTFTLPGVQPYDLVTFSMINPPAHLTLDNAYVSANNTITILWGTDGTGISTGSVTVMWSICRCENAQALPAGAAIPSVLQ